MRHMPAKAPEPGPAVAAMLAGIGTRIRDRRKALGVSVVDVAEVAGMSRVTLHRIERGEASVTIGAYLNVITALRLQVDLAPWDPGETSRAALVQSTPAIATGQAAGQDDAVPARIRLDDYPGLQSLAWSLPGAKEVTPEEALSLYERNWRHLDVDQLGAPERELLAALTRTVGHGHLLV